MSSFNEKHAALLTELDEIAKKFEELINKCALDEREEAAFLCDKFEDAEKKIRNSMKMWYIKMQEDLKNKLEQDGTLDELLGR